LNQFDFNRPAHGAYAPGRPKKQFHDAARAKLRLLAGALQLPPDSFEIRSNKAGNAVSGEVTLHGEQLYLHAGQEGFGERLYQLYFRACNGRQDYTGGRNHFAPLEMLNRPHDLGRLITRVLRLPPPVETLPLLKRL
jgi:hypothetical protein